ncbi:hypothetical protein DW785_07035 [Bacteroides xylanisolvens]|uniref:Uncharacterized protein n=1 Tax=Bacteroides xylanisolvens TaxID=371601 RepID=A0A1Y4VF07_9BACE|nr:hypothetical protein B5E52_10925 [Bacteroides xylanisolvens]RJU27354.1 hypothetical protein DXA05_18095 [Bacteroides sp. AM54-2NS]CAG9878319.1 hypothetical protein BOVA115_2346 [Bacteroides ovatus]RGI99810.1 hypothetical protein DXD80_08375 [Bacteroides xylanisolvens]RGS61203.1 hypothetical protein DWX88_04070 [Bacteroides xylanisolvens]
MKRVLIKKIGILFILQCFSYLRSRKNKNDSFPAGESFSVHSSSYKNSDNKIEGIYRIRQRVVGKILHLQ